VAALGPAYVVITSVDRDDLSDGGAAHYARCVEEIRRRAPETLVETLIPDYTGENLSLLMGGSPDVVAHNVEVVERLQRRVRDPRCSFTRSLDTLRGAKEQDAGVLTKSSLMLGLGERDDEVSDALERLRGADVDFLTLGQYLRPTANHAPVVRYVEPERFEEWRRVAYDLGFAGVASGPLVRSSYKAGELFAERIIEKRRGREWTQPERNDTP
jgi:lipoic acid synthetase